eukprot:5473577-Alexandrium_andersonii.AAC.1
MSGQPAATALVECRAPAGRDGVVNASANQACNRAYSFRGCLVRMVFRLRARGRAAHTQAPGNAF